MPILAAERDFYPENLFSLDDADRKWSVLFTEPQREKDLMRRLLVKEIPFYGVVVPSKKRAPNGRVRTSHLPLFSRYLFFFGSEDERYEAMKTNLVTQTIAVRDQAQLKTDLQRIQLLISTGAPVKREDKITTGQKVRIISGNLAGYEGLVIQRRGVDHLVVAVNFLQQGASVLLGDYQVERIG